ncbi:MULTISPECIES: glycosyltransferase family 9 protein [Butyricimonas]|uniref:glycosyltransferase family 9 protein n=1 Tax=Butyricimonas TaxID=574697 RepID=UPI0007FB365E|nr:MULTISPECIES: glycosyltransferase family 9 protein [Butyricimonas]
MAKFLIIRFSSIGDIIQCMNVVNGIKNHFPDAEIHWIARKDMGSFLNMDKRIDRVWGFDKKAGFRGLLHMAKELKAEKFDYIYDAHSNIRSNILKAVLLPSFYSLFPRGPHYTLRSKDRWKRFLLFKLGINKFDNPFRGIISYRKPLAKWGIMNFESDYSDWYFPEEFKERFTRIFTPKTITLVPSANWEMKRWPVSHWQQVIQLMPEYRFIILAGPTDTFCETIKAIAPERVNNLAGKTSLLESCYLVKQSNLVISGDTGFLHAADLFHSRSIALMGPTAFGFPSGKEAEIMEVNLPCRPCTKDGRGKCKQPVWQKCMIDITPQTVVQKARAILDFKF